MGIFKLFRCFDDISSKKKIFFVRLEMRNLRLLNRRKLFTPRTWFNIYINMKMWVLLYGEWYVDRSSSIASHFLLNLSQMIEMFHHSSFVNLCRRYCSSLIFLINSNIEWCGWFQMYARLGVSICDAKNTHITICPSTTQPIQFPIGGRCVRNWWKKKKTLFNFPAFEARFCCFGRGGGKSYNKHFD